MKRILFVAVLLPVLAFQSNKLVKTKFTENINGLLPESFFTMSEDEIIRRLPSARAPLAAYTDEARVLDFSINTSATRWAQKDIALAKDFYKANILNLFDEVTLSKDELVDINKRKYAVFEFVSYVKGDGLTKKSIRKYTYIQYTIYHGKAYVFSFNAPVQLKDKWQPVVAEVMNSIKIK